MATVAEEVVHEVEGEHLEVPRVVECVVVAEVLVAEEVVDLARKVVRRSLWYVLSVTFTRH